MWQLWLGLFGRCRACLGRFGDGKAVKAGCGLVRRGIVWRGRVWLGSYGRVRSCKARRGHVW